MKNKFNGYIKWIGICIAIAGIIWNAIELHYNTKKTTAVLQNDVKHLAENVAEIKESVKEINYYLLTERGKE